MKGLYISLFCLFLPGFTQGATGAAKHFTYDREILDEKMAAFEVPLFQSDASDSHTLLVFPGGAGGTSPVQQSVPHFITEHILAEPGVLLRTGIETDADATFQIILLCCCLLSVLVVIYNSNSK